MKGKKQTYRTAALILLVLLFAAAVAVTPAMALKVSGARIALDIVPGQSTTSPIGISLGIDESEGDYAVDVLGFGQALNDGTYTGLAAAQDTGKYSARPFITVDKPVVHLTPGGSASVTATIAVPATEKDGGRYAIVLVHPAAASSGAPAAFATAVAIPVFLTIKGGALDEKGSITGVDTGTIAVGTPFSVTSTVENTGNYHYYGIVSNVSIADTNGKVAASAKTNPMSRAIVPGQQVKIAAPLPKGLPEAVYTMTVRMETQDGTLLAQETKSLTVGNPQAITGGNTESGVNQQGPNTTYAPGPGAIAGCLAAALGIIGGNRIRRRKE